MISYAILPVIFCLLLIGCSPSSQTPTSPNPINENPTGFPQGDNSGYQDITYETMDLEQALKEYYERQNEGYLVATRIADPGNSTI